MPKVAKLDQNVKEKQNLPVILNQIRHVPQEISTRAPSPFTRLTPGPMATVQGKRGKGITETQIKVRR